MKNKYRYGIKVKKVVFVVFFGCFQQIFILRFIINFIINDHFNNDKNVYVVECSFFLYNAYSKSRDLYFMVIIIEVFLR